MKKLVVSTLCLALMFGCGGDDNTEEQPGGTAGEAGAGGAAGEAGAGGAAGEAGAGGTAGEAGAGGAAGEAGAGGTAGEAGAGGTAGEAGAGGAAGQAEAQVERGRYLVHHVADCVGCHTPRTPMGQLDETKTLAGVTCFIDVDPANDEFGCLNTRNLTNDATGLANRSDEEIRDMLIQGVRPDGTFLHPMMPYWMYTNMETGDLDAIIAYLRTVPGIENRVGNSQAPFDSVGGTVMPLDLDLVPSPAPENEHYESAMRGRYLAVNVGACIECHTPEPEMVPGPTAIDFEKLFWGGREFPAAALGLPVMPMGPFPEVIVSANLTSHMEFGLGDYTVEQIVRVLKEGVDKDDKGICPPMPSGVMAAFGGLTDDDALDIAHYIKSLPPVANEVVGECEAPMGPPPGQ